MISRINEGEKTKQDLKVRLDEAMLCLGGEVRLGKALLCLGGPESSETHALGSPRCGFLRLGRDLRQNKHSYA